MLQNGPLAGPNCCISLDRLAFFFQYEFQSTAVKNLAHLAQSKCQPTQP